MKREDMYMGQFELLLFYTKDDFTLKTLFNGSKDDIEEWQIAVEFIYRCLKSKLLYDLDVDGFDDYAGGYITSFEDIAKHIAKYTSDDEVLDKTIDFLNSQIWYHNFAGSQELGELAKECHLQGYEDYWEDDNDPRWLKFQSAIERIFAEHSVPWDFDHPLFPVQPT